MYIMLFRHVVFAGEATYPIYRNDPRDRAAPAGPPTVAWRRRPRVDCYVSTSIFISAYLDISRLLDISTSILLSRFGYQ